MHVQWVASHNRPTECLGRRLEINLLYNMLSKHSSLPSRLSHKTNINKRKLSTSVSSIFFFFFLHWTLQPHQYAKMFTMYFSKTLSHFYFKVRHIIYCKGHVCMDYQGIWYFVQMVTELFSPLDWIWAACWGCEESEDQANRPRASGYVWPVQASHSGRHKHW